MELLLPYTGKDKLLLKKHTQKTNKMWEKKKKQTHSRREKETIQRIYFLLTPGSYRYLVSFVGLFGFYFFVAVDSYLFFFFFFNRGGRGGTKAKFIIFIFFFIRISKTSRLKAEEKKNIDKLPAGRPPRDGTAPVVGRFSICELSEGGAGRWDGLRAHSARSRSAGHADVEIVALFSLIKNWF